MLINRVTDTDVRWHQEVTNAAPRVSPVIDLVLDDAPIKRAIDNLSLIKVRCKFIFFLYRQLFVFSSFAVHLAGFV